MATNEDNLIGQIMQFFYSIIATKFRSNHFVHTARAPSFMRAYYLHFVFRSPKNHAALKQFSQVPYLELKLPPPLCWACSDITALVHTSQVLAISPRDMGCERPRRDMLNLDLAFADRSSYSLLNINGTSDNINKRARKGWRLACQKATNLPTCHSLPDFNRELVQ
ncbi:unnamed protein product [Linum tenue]|uniref:Uncharacterized protein n=1 Tax=Linum tenue TaxID=586396 RepID=A0AAV0NLG2_9ROSI|nr:unnamed protein product [Linum tenue]